MMTTFQPQLLDPSHTRNTSVARDTVAVRLINRQGTLYAEWTIGDAVAEQMGLSAGDRVSLGFAQDQQSAAIGPHEGGWKLVRHGKQSVSVQIKADKLGMQHLAPAGATALPHIRYDRTLVIDINPLTQYGATA